MSNGDDDGASVQGGCGVDLVKFALQVVAKYVRHVLAREPEVCGGALLELLLQEQERVALEHRVPEVQYADEAAWPVVLHPAEVEVVADDGHGQGPLDGREPLLDGALQLGLALDEERVTDDALLLEELLEARVQLGVGRQHDVAREPHLPEGPHEPGGVPGGGGGGARSQMNTNALRNDEAYSCMFAPGAPKPRSPCSLDHHCINRRGTAAKTALSLSLICSRSPPLPITSRSGERRS